ncbi:MAG: carbohydrate ABC transporter permease [Lachnospirales bacterium]
MDTHKKSNFKERFEQNIIPYLFVLPGMTLFFLIAVIPVAQTIILSFTDWNGVTQLNQMKFIGFNNFINVFSSEQFKIALFNNLQWAVVGTTIPIVIGLVQAAIIVNSKIKFKNAFILVLFLPQILSSMIMSIMWLAIYDPASGALNAFLELIGLRQFTGPWLGSKETAFKSLLLMSIWAGYGFNTVIYSSAIRAVDQTMYEAAEIDGANTLQQFFKITIPSINKTTTTLLLLSLIGSFKVYDSVAQMTRGGPGYHTYTLSYYLYNTAFTMNKASLGCAIAVILTIIVFTVSQVFQKVRGTD